MVAAFGTKGDIRVMPQTDFPETRFAAGARVFAERIAEGFEIERVRWMKGQPVLKLAGVDDRDQAEELRGRYLRVPGGELAPLDEGEYYLFQIVGLAVESEDGRPLGTVSEVLQTGANDVYVVPTPAGELLVPAIPDVVQEVDLPGGRLRIRLMPGMLPGEAEEA
ncbi:MAG: 16S rRNA processing protein RimM [Chloroflexi bacterium]|nr:16S rRNA processing protein RimM [Chloroflexota bacterium]